MSERVETPLLSHNVTVIQTNNPFTEANNHRGCADAYQRGGTRGGEAGHGADDEAWKRRDRLWHDDPDQDEHHVRFLTSNFPWR